MKRLFLFLTIALIMTGCTRKETGTEIEITSQEEVVISQEEILVTQDDLGENLNLDYLDKVAYIEIDDVVKGKYKESIHCKLTKDEVEALMSIKDDIEKSELTEKNSRSYYGLFFYDEKGELITCWDVCLAYCVIDSNGQFIDSEGILKTWLHEVQEAHNINYSIYGRTPGENYFYGMSNIENGFCIENFEHSQGTEKIFVDLDYEDISSLKLLESSLEIIDKPEEIISGSDNLYYSINTFTMAGAESYVFQVMLDGTIYISTGHSYQVTGDGVEEWFRSIEKKYGLDKIK